jgi:hypothetical protein
MENSRLHQRRCSSLLVFPSRYEQRVIKPLVEKTRLFQHF